MPKILNNIENHILEIARTEIMAHPDRIPSIRLIAEKTNISVGTIYNYFPSKEELMVRVLIDDWHRDLKEMDYRCHQADSLLSGVKAVYDAVHHFNELYSPLFENAPYSGNNPQAHMHHIELRNELKERIDALIDRFSAGEKKQFSSLYTEALISSAVQSDIGFQQLASLTSALFA